MKDIFFYFYREDQQNNSLKGWLIQMETKNWEAGVKQLKSILNMCDNTMETLKQVASIVNNFLVKYEPISINNPPKKKTGSSAYQNNPAKVWSGSNMGQQPKIGKKDPEKKGKNKPLTSYFIFLQRNRQKVRETYPELSATEVVNVMAQIWNSMSIAEKEVYKNEYQKNKKEFQKRYKKDE